MQPHGPPQLRLGGFESATHRRFDGARVDALEPSGHPRSAVLDVALLRSLGIRTIREAFRWHLVERGSGVFDWSSARGQIEGALASDAEIIWDICHWGVPDGLDVMAPEWPGRLARFLLGQGDALKQQFLLAHLAVVEALRAEGVAPRIIVSEPRIWIVPEVGDAPEILSAR